MTSVLRAELTKLRTVPSTGWLVLGIAGLTIALGALLVQSYDYEHCGSPCAEDPVKLSLYGVRLGQIAVVALAVLAVSNEYATGLVHTTLTALPRRIPVYLGKVATVVALVLAAAVVGVAGSMLAGTLLLPGGDMALTATEPTVRAAIGTVLYCGLIAVMTAGVATVVRDTAGAIGVVLSLLYVAPIAAQFVTNPVWQQRIHRYAPMDAGLAVQATRGPTDIGPWAGLGVLAVYAAVALVAGAWAFRARDA